VEFGARQCAFVRDLIGSFLTVDHTGILVRDEDARKRLIDEVGTIGLI
jgi:hypothetical protein